eukprot:scaffold104502_cov54-Phaeocystis_antarctica.AAC.1
MPTCGCAVEIAALQKDNDAKIDALKVAHAADIQGLRQFVGMTPPSAPPSPPPSTPPSPPPPSPSPPP